MDGSVSSAPASIDLAEIRAGVRDAVKRIGRFVRCAEFKALLDDLYALEDDARPDFVLRVILNDEERKRRGIVVPDGMIIQRSTFADNRPTLFCVTQYVPLARPWHKVTITFDDTQSPESHEKAALEALPIEAKIVDEFRAAHSAIS